MSLEQVRGAAPFTHPDAFVIKDGKLYMEYSLEYKKLFIQSQNVRTVADRRWIEWLDTERIVFVFMVEFLLQVWRFGNWALEQLCCARNVLY